MTRCAGLPRLGSSLVVMASTRWSRVRFPAAEANTGMGDRLRAGKPPQYFTEPTQPLSLLPPAEWEVSTDHSAVMLCGWEFIPYAGDR